LGVPLPGVSGVALWDGLGVFLAPISEAKDITQGQDAEEAQNQGARMFSEGRMGARGQVEEVARLLEENSLPFTPEAVREMAQGRTVEGVEEVVRGVLEEGRKRTLEVYDRVWELLGLPPSPEVRGFIEGGGEVHVWCPGPEGRKGGLEVEVELVGKTRPGEALRLPTPVRPNEGLDFHFETGRVEVYTDSRLLVRGDWAFLKASSLEKARKSRRTATFLRPVLSAMGVSDLEEALEALGTIESGEVRLEGGYLLARGRGFWLLNRGSLLGDPGLDEALLTGREVVLAFPEGVEVAFRLELDRKWAREDEMRLSGVRFRLGEEAVAFDRAVVFHEEVLSKKALVKALQGLVDLELRSLERGAGGSLERASPRALLFLKAFVRHEDPLGALEEGRFAPWTVAEAFLDM
jgi:hypothetical protein